MKIVNVYEAKTHFSQLINDVLQGEEVVVARNGNPLIRLEIYNEEKNA